MLPIRIAVENQSEGWLKMWSARLRNRVRGRFSLDAVEKCGQKN
jgi:hypothetical protein